MSIIYVCDRCGDHTKDDSKMRTVSLCEDHPRDSDIAARRRIGQPESVRMLCHRCMTQVQATICEQLPQEAR